MSRVGEIVLALNGKHYIIEREEGELVFGCQVDGYKRLVRNRKEYHLTSCRRVPENQIPARVWAELAKWRLLR